MSSAFLGGALFFLIAISWILYLVQEMYISGSSALNLVVAKGEQEREQIQRASGLHWDGIEVWFIAAAVITLGGFPSAFATLYTYLYIVIFILLYVLITRGIVIETLYKLDNPKWIRYNAIAWAVSSALISFLFGIFITNLFLGIPFDNNGLTKSVLSIFNVTTISGGLLFFTISLVSGAAWIALTTTGELGKRAMTYVKKTGLILLSPVFMLLVFMGFNVHDALFIGDLFTAAPVLFALPGFAVLFSLLLLFAGLRENVKQVFIFGLLTILLFLITGFVGMYPAVLPSVVAKSYSITNVIDSTQVINARVIVITAFSFYPIIIGYQTWKYLKFKDKVAPKEE